MTTTALVKPGLRTIRLYGALAKIVGCRKLRAVVSSVSEAMRFLLANFPQIEEYLKGRFFKVKVANIALNEDDLKLPIGQTEEIHIIPAISGAGGNSGLTQILTGVALIGIGLLVPFTAPFLVPLGIGLTLTGIATLLSPTPLDREESTDAAQSYNFSGIQQTSREGPPVPLVYGDIVTGSIVLSVNIERDDEELSAEFAEGLGNPNPDPNPVPDPPDSEPSAGVYRLLITSEDMSNPGPSTTQYVIVLPFEDRNGNFVYQQIYQQVNDTSSFVGTALPSSTPPSQNTFFTIEDRYVVIESSSYCSVPYRIAGTNSGAIYVTSYRNIDGSDVIETYPVHTTILYDRCPTGTPVTQTHNLTYLGEGNISDYYSSSRYSCGGGPNTFDICVVTDLNGPDLPGP